MRATICSCRPKLNSMSLPALSSDDMIVVASRSALASDAFCCITTASLYSRFILWNAVPACWLLSAAGKRDCDVILTCLRTVFAVHCIIASRPSTPSTTIMMLFLIGPESEAQRCIPVFRASNPVGAYSCLACQFTLGLRYQTHRQHIH